MEEALVHHFQLRVTFKTSDCSSVIADPSLSREPWADQPSQSWKVSFVQSLISLTLDRMQKLFHKQQNLSIATTYFLEGRRLRVFYLSVFYPKVLQASFWRTQKDRHLLRTLSRWVDNDEANIREDREDHRKMGLPCGESFAGYDWPTGP